MMGRSSSIHLKLKKKPCIYNFLSATEKMAALGAICVMLTKNEFDICQLILVAELRVQNSTVLENMEPLLEAAANTVPDNANLNDHRRLLNTIRKACGTRVLSSGMNRMITGIGSTESAYYFVMGLAYNYGNKVKNNFKNSFGYFQESLRSGNTESYLYLGKQYVE